MTIDTLEYVMRFEAAGVDRKQAEAHAAAVRDTLAMQLATKADIDRLAQATKAADIATLEHKFQALQYHGGAWRVGIGAGCPRMSQVTDA
jgi:hypothetical protein